MGPSDKPSLAPSSKPSLDSSEKDNFYFFVKERKAFNHVTVSHDGSQVWGLSKNGQIWNRKPTGSWGKISGKMRQCKLSGDGSMIWCVYKKKKNYNVYYANIEDAMKGSFTRLKGMAMKYVSVNHYGTAVWGINKKNKVYYLDGTKWTWVKGRSLKQIEVSGDGNHAWGVSGTGAVYYITGPDGKFKLRRSDTKMSYVTVNYDGTFVLAVDTIGKLYKYSALYRTWDLLEGSEEEPLPAVKQIALSGDGNHLWAVGFDLTTYYMDTSE